MADTELRPGSTGGSGLTSKMAGIPMWGWAAIAAAGGIVIVMWWRSRKPSQSNANAATAYDASGLSTEQYESLLALLRDIQGNTARPKKAKPPGHGGDDDDKDDKDKRRDVVFHTTGRQSLNQIASLKKTSAAAIVAATKRHGAMSWLLQNYLTKHHFNANVPSGITLWIPTEAEDKDDKDKDK